MPHAVLLYAMPHAVYLSALDLNGRRGSAQGDDAPLQPAPPGVLGGMRDCPLV